LGIGNAQQRRHPFESLLDLAFLKLAEYNFLNLALNFLFLLSLLVYRVWDFNCDDVFGYQLVDELLVALGSIFW
jgi:hypothetical protein